MFSRMRLLSKKGVAAASFTMGLCGFSGMAMGMAANFILPTPDNASVVTSQSTAGCAALVTDVTGASREGLCLFVPPALGGPAYIPIAIQYDEFYSYSRAVLGAIQAEPLGEALLNISVFGDLAPPGAGQGSEDVVINTNSPGTENANVGADGNLNLEDPSESGIGTDVSNESWWGQNDQGNDGTDDGPFIEGPVTVGLMESYLTGFDPNNVTPVLLADYAEVGADPDPNDGSGNSDFLFANGAIFIVDPTCDTNTDPTFDASKSAIGCIVDEFALDTHDDGDFDPSALTLNFKETTIPFLNISLSILGSGQFDFYLLPIGFDITSYDDNHYFVVQTRYGCDTGVGLDPAGLAANTTAYDVNGDPILDPNNVSEIGCEDDGPERMFLTGRSVTTPDLVPSPGTLALLSIGIFGLGAVSRRNKQS